MALDFPNSPTVGQQFPNPPVAGVPVWKWDGSEWVLLSSTPSALLVLAIRVFDASTTYVPTAGMRCCIGEGVGGGAGGNGQTGAASYYIIGGGGGAGAYARRLLTAAQIGSSQTVTIGAGGAGGPGGGVGSPGGDTSLGALLVAKGAPSAIGAFNGGAGGLAAGCVGDFVQAGNYGQWGYQYPVMAMAAAAGAGGNSVLGAGATAQANSASTAAGLNANGPGGGGGGGSIGIAGGVGGGAAYSGRLIITEFG